MPCITILPSVFSVIVLGVVAPSLGLSSFTKMTKVEGGRVPHLSAK
jgi:hypothetical protein